MHPRGILVAAACLGAAFAPATVSAEPPLQLPWSCGDSYPVTNGHNTNTHTGMDAWAWDFGLPVGTEVVAPADGVVRLIKMNSTQGGCNSAYANDANYVVVDFGDGTEALLMHLQHDSSNLSVGQPVQQGDVVGRVGLTGWVCGAHLHFQIQQTCGSWWCQSQSASFEGVGNPGEGAPLSSGNCPWAAPCDQTLDGTTTTIDDADPACFDRISSWFWPGAEGFDDGHVYTWANDARAADTLGVWNFDVEVPGDYRLEVFIPELDANAELARYEVQTGAEILTLGPVDQSGSKGWVDIGIVAFSPGAEHWVRLADNTGEARALDRKLAFDAIRLTFEPATGSTDGGSGGSGDSGGGDGGAETQSSTGEGLPTSDGGANASASGVPDTSPGDTDAPAATGGSSGCSVAPAPGRGDYGPGAWLLCVALAGRRRRRA